MSKEITKEIHKIYEECQKIIEGSIGTIDEFLYFENEQEKAFYVALRKFFVQPQYTLKMVIEFDEEKIKKEGRYDLHKLYASLRKSFEGVGLKTVTDGVFVDNGNEEDFFIGNGNSEDFSNFAKAVIYLRSQEWFLNIVKRWKLYMENETDDLAKFYKKRKEQK